MKKLFPALLFAAVFVFFSWTPITAYASASVSQDGLEASLSCSKSTYRSGDTIDLTLTIRNHNSFAVNGIRTAIVLPDGLTMQAGVLPQNTFNLSPGESKSEIAAVTKVVVTPSQSGETDAESPPTGDSLSLAIYLVLIILSGATALFFTVKNKKMHSKRLLSLLLCAIMLMPMLSPFSAYAAGKSVPSKSFTLTQEVTVDGVSTTVSAVISYPYGTHHTVTVHSGTGGGSYAPGDTVAISAGEAPAGQHFTGWTVISGSVTLADATMETTTFTMPGESVELSANYGDNKYILTTNSHTDSATTTAGSVFSDPQARQTFHFQANTGFHIKDVLLDDKSMGPISAYTFGDALTKHTIQVIFEIDTFTITAFADTNGSIAPAGVFTVAYGGSKTFTITPHAGYHIASVFVDGIDQGDKGLFTFKHVSENHVISAEFKKNALTEEEQINAEAQKVQLSITDLEKKLLSDISLSDIIVSGFDSSRYVCYLQLEKNTIQNELSVHYTLSSISGNIQSQTFTRVFRGFQQTGPTDPPLSQVQILVSSTALHIPANQSTTFKIRLNGEIYRDQVVTIVSDNNLCVPQTSSLVFTPENYHTEQTVTVTSKLTPVHKEQTANLTLRLSGASDVSVFVRLQEDSYRSTEEIVPFASGFVRNPLQYYTAYYDVDYPIEKLYYQFNDGQWTEIIPNSNGSFTNNACMIALPYALENTSPSVQLKAVYSEKITKLSGTPTFTWEGYRIKATLDGEVEYFTPSAMPPSTLININENQTLPDYMTFQKVNAGGETEEFYLALRPKSTSKFTINGLSPTNFEKSFELSQDSKKRYYNRLLVYYTKANNPMTIQFVDATEKDVKNYAQWRTALADAVNTFNQCLDPYGFHIEEVQPGQSRNAIVYGDISSGVAGLTSYSSLSNIFTIQINNLPGLINSYNRLKAVTLHELGHLIGFEDSAYAENDSVYSYARDKEKVTYFQPNDLATLKLWLSLT